MGKTKKRYRLEKILFYLFIVFLCLVTASFPLKTMEYDIYNPKINFGLKIAQISDLHSCYYGKNMRNLISSINNEQPDIVVFTGDIFDAKLDNTNTITFLKSVSSMYPCYYVAGNHEDSYEHWPEAKAQIEKMSIKVLEGDTYVLSKGITISGAVKSTDKKTLFDKSVQMCNDNINNSSYNILLAHYPSKINYYASFDKFDLVLSGHEHGGQWRIPYIVNGIYAPDEGFLPQYAGGYYKKLRNDSKQGIKQNKTYYS